MPAASRSPALGARCFPLFAGRSLGIRKREKEPAWAERQSAGEAIMRAVSRRTFLRAVGAATAAPPALQLLGSGGARAQAGKALTIAYNVNLPSWDPTVGLSAVNPTIQSIYKTVFDQYIDQNPDLSF